MAKKTKVEIRAEKELRQWQWEQQEAGIIDYDVYIMSKQEVKFYSIVAMVVVFIVGMIFYHNIILAGLLCLIGLKFPKIRTASIIKKRKENLSMQFRDLLYSVSSSMEAGRSIEMAFKDALKDLAIIYTNPETPIMRETTFIVRKIEMNEPVEQAITEFAERAHVDDIENFADVIRVCKRTGGNLAEVVRNTSQVIGEKIETKREIETTITGKKFESRIMSVMPIFMVAVLSSSSPEFMEPVFTTIVGHVVMTIAIVIFAFSYFVSEKIVDIEV
jgi:tight adherence protein B